MNGNNQALLKLIINNYLDEAIIVLKTDFSILDINVKATKQLFSSTKEKFYGKSFSAICNALEPGLIPLLFSLRELNHSRTSSIQNIVVNTTILQKKWLFSIHVCISNDDKFYILVGKPDFLEEYEDFKIYIETIINCLPGSVYWKDKQGRYLGCNKVVAEMAGYERPEDVIGKSDFELCWKEFAREWRNLDEEVMRTGKTLVRNENVRLANKKVIIALSVKTPFLNSHGETIGIIGTSLLDVTDKKLLAQELTEIRTKEAQAKMNCAAQVSHDIRSPLAALNTVLKDLSAVSEDKRLIIRNAVRRINDISNNLLIQYRSNLNNKKVSVKLKTLEFLASLLDNLISEKIILLEGRSIEIYLDIDETAFDSFMLVEAEQFKRVLSNLLNNAIEAIDVKGLITVQLKKIDNQASIRIIDTGKGIPHKLLKQIKMGGMSYGKPDGSGIGLASAIQFSKACGGTFDLISTENKGTTACLNLPLSSPPSWFQKELTLVSGMTLVVIDDDASIHAVWSSRFKHYSSEIELVHFYDSKSARDYYSTASSRNTTFLVDYELLGSNENGLDLIEQLKINNMAILVTSRYEEPAIRERVTHLRMTIIPKNYAPFIPISMLSKGSPAIVLIDDNAQIRKIWHLEAEENELLLWSFASIADFKPVLNQLDKKTSIYIDSNLGEGIKGEDYAKELYQAGFKELYLASGFPPDYFSNMPWIKKITGKKPPFSDRF
jgi:PAS domain S-box-containing protein